MLRNMATSLFDKERITTTLGKAKELRPFAERLVTLSKRETLHARRQVLRHIHDRDVVAKLFDSISARFAQRPGGYTRIVKLGPRRGDNAEAAILELVGYEPSFAKKKTADAKGKGKAKTGKPEAGSGTATAPDAEAKPKTEGKGKSARDASPGKDAAAKKKAASGRKTAEKAPARQKAKKGTGTASARKSPKKP